MRWQTAFVALGVLVLACGPDDEPAATAPSADAALQAGNAAASRNFTAHLEGAAEVPAVQTRAQGQAIFKMSADGSAIHYKLIVANIDDVLMAHIHMAPAGSNGGVVVWLYPSAPPPQLIPGRFQGVLAEGTITAADLVGSLSGASLADLETAMRTGNTYVNVHTPANPGGEVRGQIH
jgi:hypothetical protein